MLVLVVGGGVDVATTILLLLLLVVIIIDVIKLLEVVELSITDELAMIKVFTH